MLYCARNQRLPSVLTFLTLAIACLALQVGSLFTTGNSPVHLFCNGTCSRRLDEECPQVAQLLERFDISSRTYRLQHNYEMVPGACLPRSVLYNHYQDFCKRNQIDPSSAASFGKVSCSLRTPFPLNSIHVFPFHAIHHSKFQLNNIIMLLFDISSACLRTERFCVTSII